MYSRSITLTTLLAFSLILIFSTELRADFDKNRDYHSAHTLMNYGLNMIADGSSMIISADIDIKTSIAQDPINYGKETIELGKSFVERALQGPDMVEKHMQDEEGESKMMLATHKLGQLILKAAYSPYIYESNLLKNSETAHNLLIIQLEANNALMMAAQGSNMVMTGQAGSSEKYVNRFFIDQGRTMIGNAREVIFNLLHGEEMKNLANKNLPPPEKELYGYTRKQLINSVDIVNLLYQMEFEE
jgi:hypothetical protein